MENAFFPCITSGPGFKTEILSKYLILLLHILSFDKNNVEMLKQKKQIP